MSKSVAYYSIYDITDNSKRESIIHVLKNFGMTRIQKSVFCGMLTKQQKKDLIQQVNSINLLESDSFCLLMSCTQCFGNIIVIGQDFDREYVTDKKPSMVL